MEPPVIYTWLASATTVAAFAGFIGVVVWAYSRKREQRVRGGGECAVRPPGRRGGGRRQQRGAAFMSDFTSGFWNWYVIVITAVSIFGCGWLLWRTGKVKVAAGSAKAPAAARADGKAVEITGHVWDGDLAEYNNPLPKWWVWLFWITIVFSIALPGAVPRLRQRSGGARLELDRRLGEGNRRRGREGQAAVRQVPGDGPEAGCGRSRRPARWASGCSSTTARSATARMPAARAASPTCATGLAVRRRSGDRSGRRITEGRMGVMPALGATLGDDGVKNVVAYVRSLSGLPHDGTKAELGKRELRRLRRVPRGRREGQSGDRRAEPHRQHLALRLVRGRRSRKASTRAATSTSPKARRRCPRSSRRWARRGSSWWPPTSGASRTTRRPPPRSKASTAPPRQPAAARSAVRVAAADGAAAIPPAAHDDPPRPAPVPRRRAAVRRRSGRARSRSTRSGARSTRAR